MNFRHALPATSLAIFAAACSGAPSEHAEEENSAVAASASCGTYTVTDLGILPGGLSSSANAVAASGLVAGTSQVGASNGPSHAFRWTSAGGMVDLGTLGGQFSFGYGASGARVVGQADTATGGSHAFVHDGATMTDLGALGGTGPADSSEAHGVNATGAVVGSARLPNTFLHAVMWQNGATTDLGTLLGNSDTANSRALAINDLGQIVGGSDASDFQEHAAMWTNGTVVDLGSLGVCGNGLGCSLANAVSSNGDAAGYALVAGTVQHPVLFHGGAVIDLGVPAGYQQGIAYGVNASGQVVGSVSFPPSGETGGGRHGFIYQNGTQTDLSDLVTGWHIDVANAITDDGRIAAEGNGHALLLTPQCTGAPAFKSVATTTNGTTVAKPSGAAAGDLLLAALEVDADPVTVTPPGGWTLVRDQRAGAGTSQAFHALVFVHTAAANEPDAYTFGVPDGVYTDVEVAAYTNVGTVDASAGASATGSSIYAPSVTTSAPNELLVAFYVDFAGGSWSTAQGLVARTNFDSNSLQDTVLASAGPSGRRRASDASGALAAITVALR